MKHTLDKQEKYTLVNTDEEKLDATVSSELKSLFVALGGEDEKNIIMDLNSVKYIDSSGLSAMLIANRICNEKNGTFVLVNPGEHVMKLIRISQLEQVLNILPTVEEAVDLVYMNDLEQDLGSEEE